MTSTSRTANGNRFWGVAADYATAAKAANDAKWALYDLARSSTSAIKQ